MPANRMMLALCATLLGASACAHGQRATVSAVTNKEATTSPDAEGKTRQHYTKVSDAEALGHDHPSNSTLSDRADTEVAADSEMEGVALGVGSAAKSPDTCELAVSFRSDSARLDAGSEQRLDRVAECMKERRLDHATIVGQADPSGSAQHNEDLDLERARAVAEYLRGRGVPEAQIRVREKGAVASAESRELWPAEGAVAPDVTR